jgi:hypothetical protein
MIVQGFGDLAAVLDRWPISPNSTTAFSALLTNVAAATPLSVVHQAQGFQQGGVFGVPSTGVTDLRFIDSSLGSAGVVEMLTPAPVQTPEASDLQPPLPRSEEWRGSFLVTRSDEKHPLLAESLGTGVPPAAQTVTSLPPMEPMALQATKLSDDRSVEPDRRHPAWTADSAAGEEQDVLRVNITETDNGLWVAIVAPASADVEPVMLLRQRVENEIEAHRTFVAGLSINGSQSFRHSTRIGKPEDGYQRS